MIENAGYFFKLLMGVSGLCFMVLMVTGLIFTFADYGRKDTKYRKIGSKLMSWGMLFFLIPVAILGGVIGLIKYLLLGLAIAVIFHKKIRREIGMDRERNLNFVMFLMIFAFSMYRVYFKNYNPSLQFIILGSIGGVLCGYFLNMIIIKKRLYGKTSIFYLGCMFLFCVIHVLGPLFLKCRGIYICSKDSFESYLIGCLCGISLAGFLAAIYMEKKTGRKIYLEDFSPQKLNDAGRDE